jgi:type IV pilus biogenesis protein CpaD/CtpE
MLCVMIRRNAGFRHRLAVLGILLATVWTCAQGQAETGAARLRQLQNQQAMDLRQEQQRYRSIHRPMTPADYFRLEDRLLGERIRQQALDARLQAPVGRPASPSARRQIDLMRYRREKAAQRLEFRLNRRP